MDEGTKGIVFHVFYFFDKYLSINVHLLWTQRSLCQCEESSRRTNLGRGEYSLLKELLRDHGQYGLTVTIKESECCLCVCACVPPNKHSFEDKCNIFFRFRFDFDHPTFHADLYIQGLVPIQGLELARNIDLLRKEH